MDENKLLDILNNTLQQKSSNLKNNELFGLTSLMALIDILALFRKENYQIKNKSEDNSTADNSSVNNIINKLQHTNNSDLQKLLPVLMGALNSDGGNNLGNLMNLLKNSSKQENNSQEEKNNEKNINENNSNEKKEKKNWIGVN